MAGAIIPLSIIVHGELPYFDRVTELSCKPHDRPVDVRAMLANVRSIRTEGMALFLVSPPLKTQEVVQGRMVHHGETLGTWSEHLYSVMSNPSASDNFYGEVKASQNVAGGRYALWSQSPLGETAPVCLGSEYQLTTVNCIAIPAVAAGRTKRLLDSPAESAPKKAKTDAFPASDCADIVILDDNARERVIQKARHHLACIKDSVSGNDLSQPNKKFSLVYPSMNPSVLGSSSFETRKGDDQVFRWKFRGRSSLGRDILPALRRFHSHDLTVKYLLSGTFGAGLTHLVVAAAVSLLSEGVPIVFLPSHHQRQNNSVLLLRDAILLALSTKQKLLDDWAAKLFDACQWSIQGLVKLCRVLATKNIRLVFIILELDKAPPDLFQLYDDMSTSHVLCYTVDPNSDMLRAREYMLRQDTFFLNGGLGEDEVDGWWAQLIAETGVQITRDDRVLISETTGNVPYFLEVLFQTVKKEGHFQKSQLGMQTPDIHSLLSGFMQKIFLDPSLQSSQSIAKKLCAAALSSGRADGSLSLIDRRFLMKDINDRWGCINLYALEALQRYSHELEDFNRYMDVCQWVTSIPRISGNTVMLGFGLEYFVTQELGRIGLELSTEQKKLKIPAGLPLISLPRGGRPESIIQSGIYIPWEYNHRCVDCVVVHFDEKAKKIWVVPIQISLVKRKELHSDSRTLFFEADWELWHQAILQRRNWGLDWHFVWIINCRRSRSITIDEADDRPRHLEHVVPVVKISQVIGDSLTRLSMS
ncbi:hypothetical protein K435DRAFT_202588 [Dendrothele bispora CBS 962.96]|uniref:Uncharacterized protein n=1 Tax=Dendrothele bispora (strain CBS 962.96) TaxID=1314807 RepID=A0A4S8MNI7_DENBC|nr:hypothetical protein K435DRAFT_202588 [Dendrothele bispora CBS 962.96]